MESTDIRAAGLVSAALVLSMGCAAEPAAPKTASQREAPRAAPTAAAVITHEVEDYAVWKRAFDEHAEARERAGIVGTHVNRSTDDPNLVTLYLAAGDTAALHAFLGSEDLKSTMQRAGVKGPPVIVFITPMQDQTLKDRPLPGALIKHRVADYERWRKAFDDHAAARAKAGVVGQAVNRSVDDPNLVVLYLQASSFELLRAFLDSADLKQVMTNAGVEGPPEIALGLVYPQIFAHQRRPSEEVQRATITWGAERAKTWLAILDQHWLGPDKAYLRGDTITIADYLGSALVTLGETIRFDFAPFPNVRRWLGNMKKLKSWAPVNEHFYGFANSMQEQRFVTA